jgi:hypothetical protein
MAQLHELSLQTAPQLYRLTYLFWVVLSVLNCSPWLSINGQSINYLILLQEETCAVWSSQTRSTVLATGAKL